MDKGSIIDTLIAPTRAKGVASGALSVGFAGAHSQVAVPTDGTTQMLQIVETMLYLTPGQWTMIAAILTSLWTIICIAKAFGLGERTLQFIAFLGRLMAAAKQPPPPEIVVPTVITEKEKEQDDGKAV